MLYANPKKNNLRGQWWRLPNGRFRACNHKGQQCSFKLQTEAQRFAEKGKPLNEAETKVGMKRSGGKVEWGKEKGKQRRASHKRVRKQAKQQVKVNEWSMGDIQMALRSSGIDYDKDQIEQLKRLGHFGNITRDSLLKVGLGDLQPYLWNITSNIGRKVNEAINPSNINMGGGKRVTTKKELSYSRSPQPGVVPKGVTVELKFSRVDPRMVYFQYSGIWRASLLDNAHNNFTGISKPPSASSLARSESQKGMVSTPTGKKVDPDGHGADGSPSWMLVLGLI
jgi:hypothetical protein